MAEKKLPNGMKLVFAPGCFDNFEGTQEELDQLVNMLETKFGTDNFVYDLEPIDLDNSDLGPEEILQISESLFMGVDRKLH